MPIIRPTQFKIVNSIAAEEAEERINALIKEGWTFHGDLKIVVIDRPRFVQAMCKTEAVFMPGEMPPPGSGQGLLIPRG